jgi:hypothetical protein
MAFYDCYRLLEIKVVAPSAPIEGQFLNPVYLIVWGNALPICTRITKSGIREPSDGRIA